MKISTLFYTLRQGFSNIFRNLWFSMASVATISTCLFLFGLFYAIVANVQNVMNTVEEGVSVTVFFQEGTTDERMKEIGGLIEVRDEVSDVIYISDEEAWATFGPEYFGEDYQEGFPENPLEGWDSYEVYLSDVSRQSDLVT